MATNILTKQVGPLPVGAWGVVIVGALGMAYMFNKGQSATPDESLLAEPGVGVGGGQFVYDPPTSVTPETPEATNIVWQGKAWSYLISKGHNPSQVGTALSKYLSGESLSSVEQGLVDQALLAIGVPPESFTPSKPPSSPSPIGQYTITLVSQPTTPIKKGTRMRFNGTVLFNGKPKDGSKVLVEYRNANTSAWLAYPGGIINTFSTGNWTFAPEAYKSRSWRFTVVGQNASVQSRFNQVTR